ncbi:hypothetical protein RB599_004698 [Gaeumannomyces hyphopodioides]
MAKPAMADSTDEPCPEGDGRVTANGTGTDDGSIQRGCAPANTSVDNEAEHRDSNQNRPGGASASSGPNPPASDGGDGEAPPAAEDTADDAKLDTTSTGGGEPGTAVADKKKKKKKRSGGKSSKAPTALNKIRGTGFEENFADPPMTPAEYQEEQILYDPDKYPFVERIEESIRRFRGRRRMDATRKYMFDRYLNLGGIDTSQRQFQGSSGVAPNEIDPLSAQEERLVASNDVIHRRGDDRRYYDPEEEGWQVDFTGVVSSFLSRTLPHDVAGEPDYIAQGADLILNWLNYLSHHGVCPEHDADLARARQVCAAAKAELPDISAALAAGMGQFNYACRAVFNLPADPASPWVDRISIDPAADARLDWPLVFCATMALVNPLNDDDARADMARWAAADPTLDAMAAAVTAVAVRDQTVEVVEVRAPDADVRRVFKRLRAPDGSATGAHHAPAVVVVRPAAIEDGWADTARQPDGDNGAPLLEEFVFDHAQIASMLRPGMKMRLETAEVRHPRFRLKFVAQLVDIVPSFYTFLPQELMLGFKEPIECDRDPSSVDNPGGKAWSGPFMEVYQGGECDV